MTAKKPTKKGRSGVQPRASVTFPPALYKSLGDLAKSKKVSIAWIVREAAEKYVADQGAFIQQGRGKP